MPGLPGTRGRRRGAADRGRVGDLAYGDIRIEPAPPGAPLRVEAEYDTDDFELEQGYEASGETGWTYRLGLVSKGMKFQALRALLGGTPPEITVQIPRGVSIAIEGRVGDGQSRSDLGGLWLTSVDLVIEEGNHRLSFGEPLHSPLARMSLRTGKGQITVKRVGNASPAGLEVDHSMGQLDLDLRGEWRNGSDVRVGASMGDVRMVLPDGVDFDGLDDVRVTMAGYDGPGVTRFPAGEGAPTLRFDLSITMGNLDVDH